MAGQKSTTSSGEFPIADPRNVATGTVGGRLCSVCITTKQGSLYEFPDMPLEELRRVLPDSGRVPASTPTLMMVNASISVLSIPFKIIEKVTMRVRGQAREEQLWSALVERT